MDEKLRKDVEAVVAKIFSEKEEDEIRKQTEEALSESATAIEELTQELEAKNTQFDDLRSQLSDSEEKAEGFKTELEAAKEELEGTKEKLTEAENALEEMKKDKATELRMSELEKAGVVSDKENQTVKVREMSDEDFESYKSELSTLREAILAELEKNKQEPESKKKTEAEEKSEESEESEEAEEKSEESEESEEAEEKEEGSEEDSDDLEPAEIDPKHAISAALNFEVYPSDDMKDRYSKLGQAMASLMVNKKD